MLQRDPIDRLDQCAGPQQRVATQGHRGRAGMRFHALQHHVVPALAEGALDHADHAVVRLQDRALLDVGLEVGADRALVRVAGVADLRQRLAHAHALRVALHEGVLQREGAGKHARAHHHRDKARALLVGPDRHFERGFGLDARIVQAAQHFQARQHAVVAIELAAGRLSVDVAAGDDGWQRVVATRTARKNVADRVDTHAATGRLGPAHEQIAPLAIELGERQAAHAAFGRGADARQLHQRVPQALAVHAQGLRSLESVHFNYRFHHNPLRIAFRPAQPPDSGP